MHDYDADLLEVAASDRPDLAADGAAVSVEPRRSDITQLLPGDLVGATLITASALLDVLTEDELAGLMTLCADVECPVLLTLSVVGRVELTPADPWTFALAPLSMTINGVRRSGGACSAPTRSASSSTGSQSSVGRCWFGPARGDSVGSEADLAAEWFRGWVDAACEQQTGLAAEIDGYARRRLTQATAGRLGVTVDHADVLAVPALDAARD